MKDYNTNEFRKLGITQIHVTCGIGYAKEGSEPHEILYIDFEQFIPHRDNPDPNSVLGNSLVTTSLKHRIAETGTIQQGMEKVEVIAKRALGLVLGVVE